MIHFEQTDKEIEKFLRFSKKIGPLGAIKDDRKNINDIISFNYSKL